jgi:2-keto-4-pentenoate hydratase/2-oxohepta-3-ene-1,7-dioic acid hydratase in catechol pathway
MKLLNYRVEDGLRVGISTPNGVVDVTTAGVALDISFPLTMEGIVAGGDVLLDQLDDVAQQAALEVNASWLLRESDLAIGPVLTNPGKIICVGLNYRKHAEETGAPIPDFPVLFSKFNNSIAGPNVARTRSSTTMRSNWPS